MGFKSSKADDTTKDAQRAIDEGHRIFVLQLRAGMSMTASLTRQVPGFAEVMESVEALGWVLDKSTFIIHNDKPSALPDLPEVAAMDYFDYDRMNKAGRR